MENAYTLKNFSFFTLAKPDNQNNLDSEVLVTDGTGCSTFLDLLVEI